MWTMLLPLLLFYFLPAVQRVGAAPLEDEVKFLPGLAKQPDFRHFSGYLSVAGGKHLHYWSVCWLQWLRLRVTPWLKWSPMPLGWFPANSPGLLDFPGSLELFVQLTQVTHFTCLISEWADTLDFSDSLSLPKILWLCWLTRLSWFTWLPLLNWFVWLMLFNWFTWLSWLSWFTWLT